MTIVNKFCTFINRLVTNLCDNLLTSKRHLQRQIKTSLNGVTQNQIWEKSSKETSKLQASSIKSYQHRRVKLRPTKSIRQPAAVSTKIEQNCWEV